MRFGSNPILLQRGLGKKCVYLELKQLTNFGITDIKTPGDLNL